MLEFIEKELERVKRPFKLIYIPAAIMATPVLIELVLHLNR